MNAKMNKTLIDSPAVKEDLTARSILLVQGRTGHVRALQVVPGGWQAAKKIFAFSPERDSVTFSASDDVDHATLNTQHSRMRG